MRRALSVLLVGITMAPATVLAAGDVTVVNRTGYAIDRVSVSQTSERAWGPGRSDQPMLRDGERISIALPACERACQWDLRVDYHDGQKATWSGLNLQAIRSVALYWNTRTRTTTAEPN